jgi:hypothetical protein
MHSKINEIEHLGASVSIGFSPGTQDHQNDAPSIQEGGSR